MEKEAKKKFGLHSYRIGFPFAILLFTLAVCIFLTGRFYKEAETIIRANVQESGQIMKEFSELRHKMYGLTAGFGIAAFAFSALLVHSSWRILRKILTYALALAKGNLTYRIDTNRQDELGYVCENLNAAAAKMEVLMKNIVTCAKDVTAAGNELCANADEITGQMQVINESAEEVLIGNEENQYNINNISDTMKRVDESMHELAEYAKLQNQNADRCKQKALKAQNSAKNALEESRRICEVQRVKMEKSIEAAKVVNQIREMADVIAEISDQTNLLSLNASIEAARAGEEGRGFAVVAGEVGKLAEESTRSAAVIQNTVQKVQSAFEDLKENSQELLTFIDEKLQPQMDDYLVLSEDYYTDSDEVDNLAADILVKVDKTVPEINQVTRLFADVRNTSDAAVEKTSDIQGSIQGCTHAMDSATAAAETLTELAQQLSEAVDIFHE